MSFARDVYTAGAAATDFTISFAYQDETHVTVYLDGVLQTNGASDDYTIVATTTVRFNAGLTGGETVIIQRATSQSTRQVNYTAGGLSEADLDNDSIQAFYMAQESIDIANTALKRGTDNLFTAESERLTNVADATSGQDAVTKTQLDAVVAAAGNVPTPDNPGDDGSVLSASGGTFDWSTLASLGAMLNSGDQTLTDGDFTIERTDSTNVVVDIKAADGGASNLIGGLQFTGQDDMGADQLYGRITVIMPTTTAGSEDGQIRLSPVVAGTEDLDALAVADGVTLGAVTAKGAGSLNAENGVYVDGVSILAGLRNYIAGLVPSNAADASHDITISAGAAVAADQSAFMVLTSALTKQIDAAWAVGTDAGGLDGTESVTGTPDANTWYHLWLIRRSDTGVVDALFSESASAPTMPTNYDQKRLIGSVLTDGSANIIAFSARELDGGGLEMLWDVVVQDINVTNPGTSAVTRTLGSIPTGYAVTALLNVVVENEAATANGATYLSALDVSDQAADYNAAPGSTLGSNFNTVVDVAGQARVRTNTSAQIRSRASGSSTNTGLELNTLGWEHSRR